MRAYDISESYKALEDIADFDPETGELLDADAYNELLSNINDARDDKLINIENLKLNINGDNELISNEIKRLQFRKKANDTKIERLKDLQFMLVGDGKVETPNFTFSKRKSESVQVPDNCDPKSYPQEWVKASYSFDKKVIKESLKNSGIDYIEYGIEIVTNYSLQVK